MYEETSRIVYEFCKGFDKFSSLQFEQHGKSAISRAFFIEPTSQENIVYVDGTTALAFNFRVEIKTDFSRPDERFNVVQELNQFISWLRANYKSIPANVQSASILQPASKFEVQNTNLSVWGCVLQLTFGE